MSSAATRPAPDNAPVAAAKFSLAAINFHQRTDRVAECLIYAMVIFSPWAFGCTNTRALQNWTVFGSTQVWTIWAMSFAGYLLGALVLAKLAVNFRTGYRPPRWSDAMEDELTPVGGIAGMLQRAAAPALVLFTALILLYCLTSALNARATYRDDQLRFEYFEKTIAWLPHSYDKERTWTLFWNYLGLAGAFWGIRDWLLGKTTRELRAERKTAADAASPGRISLLPERLRRLLWVMSINGAMLAIEGIAQRLSGTNKLLWWLPTRLNHEAQYQFGPYAYRSNAAQYFNLLWPVTLGFWWTQRRAAQIAAQSGLAKPWRHHLLLPAVTIMAICPIISYSRGGAIIAAINIALATLILLAALKKAHGATKFGMFAVALVVLVVGFGIGGQKLGDRMKETGSINEREQMYDVGHAMADEHPVFGTGPGSFNMLFQFYRSSPDDYWPAQLHNDWLETRITFGRVGSALIAAAFLLVALRRWLPGGIRCGWRFAALIWLGLVGCLAHARYDFPMQVHSILFLFLILCAVLFNLSRAPAGSR